MKFLLPAAIAACLTFTAFSASAEVHDLPLKPLRERLRTIQVEINGHSADFLLDTGGGVTTVSPDFAARIGCTPWGRITGHRMFGDRLDMTRCDDIAIASNGVPLGTTTVAVLDSTPYLQPGQTAPDGVLAMDVFADKVITLDVAGNRLTIEDDASLPARIAGAVEAPLKVSREVWAVDPYIGVDTPRGRLWFILDSGAGGVMLIARDNAADFGLDPLAEGPQPLRFDILPGMPIEGPAVTPEMMLLGNLGMPFMRDYVLTFDFPNQRLWLRRNPK